MACRKADQSFDASGSFEATEIMISSEVGGNIQYLALEEGDVLSAGQLVAVIDSTQLYLKKQQLLAQIAAVNSKQPNVAVQMAAAQEQLVQANRELERIKKLYANEAATAKQLDDATTAAMVAKKQVAALQSSLNINSGSLSAEVQPLRAQLAQVQDQLSDCRVINPINGTVINKLVDAFEMVSPGKPLYKIAKLDEMYLRAYISGDQFAKAKLGAKVQVFTDDGQGGYKAQEGLISWINDKAEFTPKTIQTKNERANLVYAIKVKVKNDGMLKIGMYGHVSF
jgi:HlyD family secretion protein